MNLNLRNLHGRHLHCALVPLALALVVLPGCSGEAIREGVWELSFDLVDDRTQQKMPIPPRLALVRVEENDSGDGLIAEISPMPRTSRTSGQPLGSASRGIEIGLKSMYADIRRKRENEPLTVSIMHQDDHWIFSMFGQVVDSEKIAGVRFVGRHRLESIAWGGRWSMLWLRDF